MEKENGRCSRAVYETAIGLTRMWGVMETLKPLPYLDFQQVLDMVLKWAQEYVNSGQEDMVEFFQERAIQVAGRECMLNNYDFEITEDSRSRDDKVTKMCLENPYYKVKVYYMGFFNTDRDSGGLDPHVLSISVKPKESSVIGFTYYLEASYLDLICLGIRPMDEVLAMFEPIKKAVESEKALRAQLEKILNPMRPWEAE